MLERILRIRLFGALIAGAALIAAGCDDSEPVDPAVGDPAGPVVVEEDGDMVLEDDYEVEVEDGEVQEVDTESDPSEAVGLD